MRIALSTYKFQNLCQNDEPYPAVGDQGCDAALCFAMAVIFLCLDKTAMLPVHRKVSGDAFCSGAITLPFLSRQDCDANLWLVAQQGFFATVSSHLVMWFGFLSMPSVTISFSPFSLSVVFSWNWCSWVVNKHLLYDYILPDQSWRTCITYIP